jgi:uracil-DNA glycosylase family 4
MRATSTDIIAGLKFCKQAILKTEHKACQYFHFTPQRIWTYNGDAGASLDVGLGFTGRVKIQEVLELIKNPNWYEAFEDSPKTLVHIEELESDCPFPTDSQFNFYTENTKGLSEALAELYKTFVKFPGWLTSSVLLGQHALIAADGYQVFGKMLNPGYSSADAAVIPERFGRLIARLGDPTSISAKKYIKAVFQRGAIRANLFSDYSSVVISEILGHPDKYNKFLETTNHAHIVDGRLVERHCSACELSYQCRLNTNRMNGEGAPGAIMFCGKHPGKDDDSIGRPMTGPNGKIFWELLRDAGYKQGEVYVTNCIKCAPITMNATQRHWKACQNNFLEELARVKPKMVVAVGAEATEFLTGKTGIMGLRGKGLSCALDESYTVYPIRQPMALEHANYADRESLKATMVADLRELRSILYNGGKVTVDTVEDSTDYKIAETPEDVDAFLEELDKCEELGCDLETTGFDEDEEGAAIVAIGFSKGPGHGRAIPLLSKGENSIFWWADDYLKDVLTPKIVEFVQRKKIFGHNFIKFDCRWMRKHWGIDPQNIDFDTLLGSYASYHGLRSYELEVLANSFCGMTRWKREFTLEDTRKLCIYLCKDVDATFRVREVVEKNIDQRERWLLKNILVPVARELSYIEERGVRIDIPQIDKVDELLRGKIEECLHTVRTMPEVAAWEIENGIDFNPDSTKHVGDVMYNKLKLRVIKRTKHGKPSADREVMEVYEEENPFCGEVMRFKRLSKLRGTYVDGMKKEIRNEVIHTHYKEHFVVTGRLSSSSPNLQNIPREDTAAKVLDDGSDIKRMFIPRPGHCFLQADYSQVELRVLACLAGDQNMQQAFIRGEDIHKATAAKVYGVPLDAVTKAMRDGAKRTNFGIVYGMQLPSLIKKFVDAGSSEQDAKNFWDRHHDEFPLVWKYMSDQEQLVIRNGQQTTYFGRTRIYETKDAEAFRQAYNFPIQSTASDLTLLSIIRTGRVLRELRLGAHPVLTVHDSIIFEVPIDEFWYVAKLVKTVMESQTYPWLVVPIRADLQAGPNWGHLLDVDIDTQTLKNK